MLGRFRQFQIRLAAVACLSLPALSPAQDAVPAPPPPGAEADAVPEVPETAPAPDADGVARVPAAGCRTGACGPAAACTTDGASCSPAGKCRSCNSDGACRTGACAAHPARGSACRSDAGRACNTGGAGNGLPCLTCPGSGLSPEVCMGRGYTIGDLKRSLHGLKCRARTLCGLDQGRSGGRVQDWWCGQQYRSNCRRAYRNQVWNAHLHNKLNYFIPGGCCGEGCPPFGEYKRVYAADPGYFDQRDAQVYAAPATGVPTAVPLAPNVRYQYNYGWGIPSSRVTPISNLSLQRR